MAGTMSSAQRCEVSSVDPPTSVFHASTDGSAGDPVSTDPESAVEQEPVLPAQGVDPGIERVHPPDPILVEVSSGGFGAQYLLTVSQSGRATITRFSRGSQSDGSFTLSRSNLAALTSLLQHAHFRSLRSRYLPSYGCKDCPSSSITFAGRTITIAGFTPFDRKGIPPRLYRVVSLATRLIDAHASLV
jgi:hypothetical protein